MNPDTAAPEPAQMALSSKPRHDTFTRFGRPPKHTKKHYSDDEKRSLVKQFMTRGEEQALEFSRKHDLSDTVIRRWMRDPRYAFKENGATKMPKPALPRTLSPVIEKVLRAPIPPKHIPGSRNYTDAFRDAVMSVFLKRQALDINVKVIAEHFDIPSAVVYSWASQRGIAPTGKHKKDQNKELKLAATNEPHAMIARSKADRPKPVRKQPLVVQVDRSNEVAILKLKLSILQGIVGLAVAQGFQLDADLLGSAT